MSKYKKKLGFTLIELMIAAAVVVIAFTGLLAMYIVCLNLAEEAHSLTVAVYDASKIMERIRVTNFDDIATTDWTAWAAGGGGCNTLTDEAITVSFSGTNPLQATILVSWKDRQRPRSERIIGLISER